MTTDFQSNLLKFISEYIAEHSQSPSFSQMTAAMNISARSKSLITRSLKALNKEKKIELKREGRRLIISLTSKQLLLVGTISAGSPIEAIADHRELNVDQMISGENRFALKVKGDSMIEEGILDGDIIICRQASHAREGEIVVAIIDQHHTTLKRISYKMKNMITLIPSNSNLKPRAYAPERIFIQGIYVGLIRINT